MLIADYIFVCSLLGNVLACETKQKCGWRMRGKEAQWSWVTHLISCKMCPQTVNTNEINLCNTVSAFKPWRKQTKNVTSKLNLKKKKSACKGSIGKDKVEIHSISSKFDCENTIHARWSFFVLFVFTLLIPPLGKSAFDPSSTENLPCISAWGAIRFSVPSAQGYFDTDTRGSEHRTNDPSVTGRPL